MLVSDLESKVQARTAELAERTAQLEQRTHQLEAFSYSVSHDLRAPLRAISGFAHILSQRHAASLDEKGKHCIDNILEASSHMARLIDDMLNYSRLGRAAIVLKPTDLHQMLLFIKRNLDGVPSGTVDIPDDIPAVMGDATLLSQIFTNLIDNGLKYRKSDVPPTVTISWTENDDCVTVHVTDNGIGIDRKHFDKIFEVFQRLHGQDQFPGTGIGLSVVRKACELQDATVSLESTLGVGTTFSVHLKRVYPTTAAQAHASLDEVLHAAI
jgi:light-regulated signal transduction histidine kinase (bacteriophytochrome)